MSWRATAQWAFALYGETVDELPGTPGAHDDSGDKKEYSDHAKVNCEVRDSEQADEVLLHTKENGQDAYYHQYPWPREYPFSHDRPALVDAVDLCL